ncbi:MerR family transcriptional regulator [Salinisphaera aquimarina]|uniref:MerR family transcriptional regulator n=1 Tax=Salinisphaera aquimarina TaxID=2094031 RepID=A0ABV7EME2_9GAMM
MRIAEFAERSGVGVHTLRYYERIGLLPAIARNVSGHRQFSEGDLDWVAFITRLKNMGMPLAQIRRYAQLRAQGDSTAHARMILLQEHATAMAAKIATAQDHLATIHDKIAYYRSL